MSKMAGNGRQWLAMLLHHNLEYTWNTDGRPGATGVIEPPQGNLTSRSISLDLRMDPLDARAPLDRSYCVHAQGYVDHMDP